jgi:hypothetical protein
MAVAFRSAAHNESGSGSSSLAISKPSGTANGDFLIAFIVISGDGSISAAPSGWALVDSQSTGSATGDCRHAVYTKTASSEPSSWTWTFSGSVDNAGAVLAYTGVTSLNTSGFTKMSSSTVSLLAESVTPTAVDCLIISAYGVNPVYDGDLTFTTPSGLTSRVEADPGSPTTNRAVLKVFDRTVSAADPTGDKATTINDYGKGVAYTVALAPSGGTIYQIASVGPTRTSTGAMAGWWAASGYPGDFDDDEQALGKTFPVVRLYHQPGDWGDTSPYISSDVDDAITDGRLVLSSHKEPGDANAWKDISDGRYDTWIRNLADAYKDYNKEVVVILSHEPHDACSNLKHKSVRGTSDDMRNAFRRFTDLFEERGARAGYGGKIKMGYCAVWSRCRSGSPPGESDPCYPGDGAVDVICPDIYNWYEPHSSHWEDFENEWKEPVDFAGRHDKPIIAGEIGCHASADGHSRSQWFRDMADWIQNDTTPNGTRVSKYFLGFCYFHSPAPKIDWTFLNPTIPPQSNRFGTEELRYAYGSNASFGGPNPYYRDGVEGWKDAFVDNSFWKGSPIDMGPPGQTDEIVDLNLSGAGAIASKAKVGRPSITLVGGAVYSIYHAGGIAPRETPVADFSIDPVTGEDDGAGTDPGGFESDFSVAPVYVISGAGGIESTAAVGTPYKTFDAAVFTPPAVYDLPLNLRHFRNAPRGRTLIHEVGDTFRLLDTPDPATVAASVVTYQGGHLYNVSSAEATLIARAGYGSGLVTTGIFTPATSTWAAAEVLTWGGISIYQWGYF